MQLIDTFLFSEPYEADLLWIKFHLEDNGVDEWIIAENSYTHQGTYKGYYAKKLIETDDRFAPFRHKITIIEGNIVPDFKAENKASLFENHTYGLEFAQRELATEYILNKYRDDVYVFISDSDEMLDLSDPGRKRLFFKKLKGNDFIKVPRNRFWYDYDNYWMKVSITPVVTVRYIKQTKEPLGLTRKLNMATGYNWSKWICFEYSFCFNNEIIQKKYENFLHTGYLKEEIERGIQCNHRPVSSIRGEHINLHPRWWMKKVRLNARNSPAFVRQHFNQLKTDTINKDYLKKRAEVYPSYFSERFPAKQLLFVKRMIYYILYMSMPFIYRVLKLGRYKQN